MAEWRLGMSANDGLGAQPKGCGYWGWENVRKC